MKNKFRIDSTCCFHSTADVTAGRGMLNGSGIYFDQDTYYPHWYKNFFNKTIPLFGPYAWRADDFYGLLISSSYHMLIKNFLSFQIHSTGDINGPIIPYNKKILVPVVIITILLDIVMLMNGIANGYQIKQYEVSKSKHA